MHPLQDHAELSWKLDVSGEFRIVVEEVGSLVRRLRGCKGAKILVGFGPRWSRDLVDECGERFGRVLEVFRLE